MYNPLLQWGTALLTVYGTCSIYASGWYHHCEGEFEMVPLQQYRKFLKLLLVKGIWYGTISNSPKRGTIYGK